MVTEENDVGSGHKMTPEQQAKLRNFGKKNGLSEQKIQTQLATKQPIQPVQQVKVAPPTQPTQNKKAFVAPQQQASIKPSIDECQTYFCYQDEEAGNLEIDLITFREKGQETRYLSLLFSGLDVRQNPPTPQEAYLNIESKEAFEEIKAFFAQLDWED